MQAQQAAALGLYEGMMGNSGAAFFDSSAPSYYNPSLLSRKKQNSYSLAANSFGTFSSKSEGQQQSSLSLTPNYLGSVLVGDALVHEIFFSTLMPSKINAISIQESATERLVSEAQIDSSAITFGYSMAFRKIPFALSYFGNFLQMKTSGFNDYTSLTSTKSSTTQIKSELTSLEVGISASTHINFDQYTFGANLRTRKVKLYKSTKGSGTVYLYDQTAPTNYTKTEFSYTPNDVIGNGYTAQIGHSFKVGDHEFLTDSILSESPDLDNSFSLVQTFGYRMTSKLGHQFLCGVNHLIDPKIKYFGQSAYYSAGYSWLTRAMRSAIGIYYYSSRLDQEISAMGLSFGSEFNY